MHSRLAVCLSCAVVIGCSGPPESTAVAPEPADANVQALADAYLTGYLNQVPETATYYGIPGQTHDKLSDNSPAALARWHAQEDAWLGAVRAIDTARISSRPLKATHAIVLEALESSIASRVCRNELWNVSQMTGWHVNLGYVVTIQPVGTDRARQEALARWGSLPKYIDVEIANLREGIKRGFTAPRHIVRIVIDQVRSLASTPPADSPFLAPARSDKTPGFVKTLGELTTNHIVPAARRYADFLEREYLPAARETIAVASHPDGAVCYGAAVRAFSTLPKTAKEVHDIGLREVARIDAEMKTIAVSSFGTGDVPALMQRLRTDRKYMFRNRKELIAYSMAALDRARAAAPQWFGLLPKADVRIEPYPAYREKNSPGEYNPSSEDGSRPALFYISAYEAEKKSRADNESTAFHETIPGHHLQGGIALERRRSIHSAATSTTAAMVRAGRCTPRSWPTRCSSFRATSIDWGCWGRRTGVPSGWSSIPACMHSGGPGSRRSTTCWPTLRRTRTTPQPRSTVTSSGLARPRRTCSAGSKSSPRARRRARPRATASTSRRSMTACWKMVRCRSRSCGRRSARGHGT